MRHSVRRRRLGLRSTLGLLLGDVCRSVCSLNGLVHLASVACFVFQAVCLDVYLLKYVSATMLVTLIAEVPLLFHLLWYWREESVLRAAPFQWLVYSWVHGAKVVVLFCKVMPVLPTTRKTFPAGMRNAIVTSGYFDEFYSPSTLVSILLLTPLFYMLLMFRSSKAVFGTSNRITVDLLMHYDMLWHVALDAVDSVELFLYSRIAEWGSPALLDMYPEEIVRIQSAVPFLLFVSTVLHGQSLPGVVVDQWHLSDPSANKKEPDAPQTKEAAEPQIQTSTMIPSVVPVAPPPAPAPQHAAAAPCGRGGSALLSCVAAPPELSLPLGSSMLREESGGPSRSPTGVRGWPLTESGIGSGFADKDSERWRFPSSTAAATAFSEPSRENEQPLPEPRPTAVLSEGGGNASRTTSLPLAVAGSESLRSPRFVLDGGGSEAGCQQARSVRRIPRELLGDMDLASLSGVSSIGSVATRGRSSFRRDESPDSRRVGSRSLTSVEKSVRMSGGNRADSTLRHHLQHVSALSQSSQMYRYGSPGLSAYGAARDRRLRADKHRRQRMQTIISLIKRQSVVIARERSAIISILFVDLPFCAVRVWLWILSLEAGTPHFSDWGMKNIAFIVLNVLQYSLVRVACREACVEIRRLLAVHRTHSGSPRKAHYPEGGSPVVVEASSPASEMLSDDQSRSSWPMPLQESPPRKRGAQEQQDAERERLLDTERRIRRETVQSTSLCVHVSALCVAFFVGFLAARGLPSMKDLMATNEIF